MVEHGRQTPFRGVSLYALDPDFRKDPETKRFCIVCQRDLKPDARIVKVRGVKRGDNFILVEDENGEHLVGSGCIRKFRKALADPTLVVEVE